MTNEDFDFEPDAKISTSLQRLNCYNLRDFEAGR